MIDTDATQPLQMSRRGFLQAAGATGLSLAFLSACGGGGGGAASGDVSFWYAFTNAEGRDWYRANVIDAFNKAHPKAPVVLSIKQPATLDQLLRTALAAGKGPDLVATNGPSYVGSYSASGLLRPLDDQVDQFGWAAKFLPWALDAGRIGGKLYSLPSSYESMIVLYNPALFDKKGWTPPTTRAEFESICREAAGDGIMPIAAGSAEWQGATEWHVTNVLNAHAGPQAVYDALSGKVRWTDPAFVDSITLLQSWFDKGWMGGDKQRYFTNKFGDLYTKLAAEKAAMCVTGSWSFTEVPPFFGKAAGNDASWAWAPLPSLGDHVRPAVFPLGIGSNLSIRKGAPNPKAAATFLDFALTDKPLQTKGIAEVSFSPAPVRLSDSDFPPSVDERLRSFYTQLSSSDNVGYTSWTFWPPKSDTYLYIEMEKVITGKVTPKAFCEGLDTLFQQELKAGTVPPRPRPGPGA